MSSPTQSPARVTTSELAPALAPEEAADPFTIAGETFTSRLLLGTGGVPSLETLEAAVRASGTQLVTVALRRVEASSSASMLEVLDRCGVRLLPNTAGCRTAREAVLTARLAREAFGTSWVSCTGCRSSGK